MYYANILISLTTASLPTAVPFFNKAPTFPKLIELSVPQQIGTSFKMFGILLLNDDTGIKMNNIEEKLRGDPERISMEIIQNWLQGKGQSITWETLIDTLRKCNLNTLADQIEISTHVHL